jgi:hypothetical protein
MIYGSAVNTVPVSVVNTPYVAVVNTPTVITNLSITSTTTLSFTAPGFGTTILTLVGSGTEAYLIGTLSGISGTWAINGGNALASGAIYEFQLHMLGNDVISSVSNATFIRLIFINSD